MSKKRNLYYSLIKSEKNDENDYLFFYTKLYNAINRIERLYDNGYDYTKNSYYMYKDGDESDLVKEYMELKSLLPCICSVLMGLNRENVQLANTKSDRKLFEYRNYVSDAKVVDSNEDSLSIIKKLMRIIKFNKNLDGALPNIVDIEKIDNKQSAYDVVTKIRNGLLHSEYYQPKGDLYTVKVQNHKNNNLIFESNLLEMSFTQFVEDYYGFGLGVASHFDNFRYALCYDLDSKGQIIYTINSKEELKDFLKSFTNIRYVFTEVPESLTFNGKSGIYDILNDNYELGGIPKRDISDVLKELKDNGVKYKEEKIRLTDEEIDNIVLYLEKEYKDRLYNNRYIINEIICTLRLFFSPNCSLANCYNNILRYIRLRNNYIFDESKLHEYSILNEMKSDKNSKLAFKIALILLRINVINYLIEADDIEIPDLSKIDLSNFNLEHPDRLKTKIDEELKKGIDPIYVKEYVVLKAIRNALAHGQDRVKIILSDEVKIRFIDKFEGEDFVVEVSLSDLEKIYKSDIFRPENQVLKQKEQVKKLIKENV